MRENGVKQLTTATNIVAGVPIDIARSTGKVFDANDTKMRFHDNDPSTLEQAQRADGNKFNKRLAKQANGKFFKSKFYQRLNDKTLST